ncbi:uncharacterized protein [Musca autumnalis]|uniref:uncharacterized protein n=1 Tax=Musca autumnalis TaxID=221902 RepID=UPI003CEF61AC
MTSNDTSGQTADGNTTTQVQHLQRLKQQRSFEQRYASIINQQILEKTINREVLQRQANAFFPFGRSVSSASSKGQESDEDDEDCNAEQAISTSNEEQ